MRDLSARIVIAGGGHAGGAAAAALRQFGWKGQITIIGEEPVAPYQRPPLSKTWLKGETDFQALLLRAAHFYETNNVSLHLSQRVTGIEREQQQVALASGEAVPYDHLILALGAVPRTLRLPGIDLGGVLTLRSVVDADHLKPRLHLGARIIVAGGGYIGLEVAASARSLGADVVVIEREERVLSRVASPAVSAFFQNHHASRGVRVECGASIEELEGQGGQVRGARLSDGRFVECDTVLIAVGVAANDQLGRAAGLPCDDGIVVDLAARTADTAIHAIGDCTRRPLPLYGCTMRLESVPNALEQAKQAAADLCGRPPPAPEAPWFWSDQYEARLQIAGMPIGAVECITRGDPRSGSFAVFHLSQDGVLLTVEAVNAAADFVAGRTMVARRQRIAPDVLRDPNQSLRELAKA
ncbi:MAG: FAD-dependent oxidoreductase [Acetobacteraceae bacterium]|nr:FAD-dependent oxidoreductase [Acetobacteraceae bacterium]